MISPERRDYALRALLQLASDWDRLVPSGRLATEQDIPGRDLEVVMTELRRSGLVTVQRGPDGGYTLARPPAAISLADIRSAIAGAPPADSPG
jgi:Rrf2 family protein